MGVKKHKTKSAASASKIDNRETFHIRTACIVTIALLFIAVCQWVLLYVGVPFEKFFSFWFWPHTSNIFEFFYWAGFCILAVFILVIVRTIVDRFQKKNRRAMEILTALFLSVLTYLAFFTNTTGETARLWIILLPLLSVFVAHAFQTVLGGLTFTLLAGIQVVTASFFKLFQDFY